MAAGSPRPLYNVRVYRNGRKILSRWPRNARFPSSAGGGSRGPHGSLSLRRLPVVRLATLPHSLRPTDRSEAGSRRGGARRPDRAQSRRSPSRRSALDGVAGEVDRHEADCAGLSLAALRSWGRSLRGHPRRAGAHPNLTAADIDATVRAVVTASNWLGQRSAALRTDRGVVLPVPPILVAAPQIHGRPQVGRTLISDVGAWTSSRPLTYKVRWELCGDTHCRSISGSPGRSLLLRASALERHVRVVVTATSPGGSTRAVSPPTDKVRTHARGHERRRPAGRHRGL